MKGNIEILIRRPLPNLCFEHKTFGKGLRVGEREREIILAGQGERYVREGVDKAC